MLGHPLVHSAALALVAGSLAACAAPPAPSDPKRPVPAESVRIQSPASVARPPFQFSTSDDAFLEDVSYGAFQFLWDTASKQTGMPPDRASNGTVSVAGVGFFLSGLPIAVERGWVTRAQATERALLMLRTLEKNPAIRKAGLFQHYLDGTTGGIHPDTNLEHVVSTIDSALLFAGILTASSYFGGEVQVIGDRLFTDANWQFFLGGSEGKPHERGFISLGWKPKDKKNPAGDGARLPYYWMDSGCEHRLTTFLAVCAPKPEHRADATLYYKLRRQLGQYTFKGDPSTLPSDLDPSTGPVVWFPYSGALFVNTFSHLWINYAALGADNPAALGVAARSPVDWWENSRRMTILHRLKAIENPKHLPTLGVNAWGLTASDYPKGYLVAGVFPDDLPIANWRPDVDYSKFRAPDEWGDGTIAPYGAGCAILFQPDAAVRAMRHYQSLRDARGEPLAWRDPRKPASQGGGYGFVDAFNLKGPDAKPWATTEYLAIDQGPLLLAIENARTGSVWKWFHAHPFVQAGLERLKLGKK